MAHWPLVQCGYEYIFRCDATNSGTFSHTLYNIVSLRARSIVIKIYCRIRIVSVLWPMFSAPLVQDCRKLVRKSK